MRHALRSLRRSPGLVIVSVLSLGLGLGVNLTLFTAIGAVFFFEPTVADRDRVVAIQPGNSNQFSYLNYLDVLASGVFESATGHRRAQLISLAVARVAAGLLAGLSPADPITFAGTAAILTVVGIGACYLPARRAAAVDPMVALRRL
jgi:ABC-type antimicrobial peptide transport system permease subunit